MAWMFCQFDRYRLAADVVDGRVSEPEASAALRCRTGRFDDGLVVDGVVAVAANGPITIAVATRMAARLQSLLYLLNTLTPFGPSAGPNFLQWLDKLFE